MLLLLEIFSSFSESVSYKLEKIIPIQLVKSVKPGLFVEISIIIDVPYLRLIDRKMLKLWTC